MKIAAGCDHAGFELKSLLVKHLLDSGYQVDDVGTYSDASVDYPVYGAAVGRAVARGDADLGLCVCGTGMGIAMAANKIPGVRAAVAHDVTTARLARQHNESNVICFGGRIIGYEVALEALDVFLNARPLGERHHRRVEELEKLQELWPVAGWVPSDTELETLLWQEANRQSSTIQLIASENFTSPAVLAASGSVLTNKYAEGYPGRRYYSGCEAVDKVEELAIARAKTVFGAEHVNVQPHSGSQANMAVYLAAIRPGDTILGMNLSHGGHLTHGASVSFSGHYYKSVSYGVDPKTGLIDMDQVRSLAREHRPRIIIAGASSYPRTIDFAPFRAISDEVGATFLVDMAHISGLVAAGLHPSPFPVADYVTTSTHKTLRGPRGGMAFSREAHAKALDKAVFPMMQGGPLMHVVAGKAVMLREAMDPSFRDYMARVVDNCRVLAQTLTDGGYHLLTGGTDNHLLLIDLRPQGLTGRDAEQFLSQAGIFVNKNGVPFDDKPPTVTSGIRIGTPAATTRGLGQEEMRQVGLWIREILDSRGKAEVTQKIAGQVRELLSRFPIYGEIRRSGSATPR